MKKKIRFIINPISGIGKKNTLPDLIEHHLDQDRYVYEIVHTEYRGHARLITKEAIAEGFDIVCVAGGDGSVNEVGTELINTKTRLAILPTGSGNGIARHLGLSMKLKKAILAINEGKSITIDTISLNDKLALGFAGFGYDASVAKKFDEYHSRGFLSYAKLVLKEFKNYEAINVTINGKTEHSNLLFCTIANISQFGNNFYISPQSDIHDGKFEIVLVSMPKRLGFIKLLFDSAFKRVHKSKYVQYIKAQEATIVLSDVTSHVDGDPYSFETKEIEIKCYPNSLSVIV